MCEQQKNKPHVHAELIKAWADGAIIEIYNSACNRWQQVACPEWNPTLRYRIQPAKKSPGQIAFEGYTSVTNSGILWDGVPVLSRQPWEAAAQAVIDSLKQK